LLGRDALAISRAMEAISLNPNSSMAHYVHGFVLGRAGRLEDAIAHISHAIRISPRDMFSNAFLA
jgi:Flp pilus assembly protein TadD